MRKETGGFDSPTVLFFFATYILMLIFGVSYVLSGPFRKIPGMDLRASLRLLWCLVGILGAGGAILRTACRDQPLGGCIPNVVFPFGVYTVMAYRTIRPKLLVGLFLLAGMVCTAYTVLILRKKSRRPGRRSTARKLCRALVGIQSTLAFLGIVAMIVCFMRSSRVSYSMTNIDRPAIAGTQAGGVDAILAACQEDVKQLHPGTWDALSVEERGNLLQVVANIETVRYGLPHELNVALRDCEESTLAFYQDSEHLIVISTSVVESEPVETAIRSICHEAAHAYQHWLADLYETAEAQELLLLQDARIYAGEFENYINGNDPNSSFEDYYRQHLEVDARSAGQQGVERWNIWVCQYVDGEETPLRE